MLPSPLPLPLPLPLPPPTTSSPPSLSSSSLSPSPPSSPLSRPAISPTSLQGKGNVTKVGQDHPSQPSSHPSSAAASAVKLSPSEDYRIKRVLSNRAAAHKSREKKKMEMATMKEAIAAYEKKEKAWQLEKERLLQKISYLTSLIPTPEAEAGGQPAELPLLSFPKPHVQEKFKGKMIFPSEKSQGNPRRVLEGAASKPAELVGFPLQLEAPLWIFVLIFWLISLQGRSLDMGLYQFPRPLGILSSIQMASMSTKAWREKGFKQSPLPPILDVGKDLWKPLEEERIRHPKPGLMDYLQSMSTYKGTEKYLQQRVNPITGFQNSLTSLAL